MENGQAVKVRGMQGTVLRIDGERILVEAQRNSGGFVNIWVNINEIEVGQ